MIPSYPLFSNESVLLVMRVHPCPCPSLQMTARCKERRIAVRNFVAEKEAQIPGVRNLTLFRPGRRLWGGIEKFWRVRDLLPIFPQFL